MNRDKFARKFWKRCQWTANGCLEWQGARCGVDGRYGQSYMDGRRQMAHRVAWQLTHGPLPNDVDLDHRCLNPACVNPEHLEPSRHAEHLARHAEERSTCRRGHHWTAENTYIDPQGRRQCRTCLRDNQRRWREKHQARRVLEP